MTTSPRRKPPRQTSQAPAPGQGVDARGGPVVDPTENVIALNEAASQRQDDLRALNNTYLEARIRGMEEKSDLRAQHNKETALLRAEHAKEIREMESTRLNAIRQVDVTAVNTAADRAGAAIQALAVTTAANAENLRNALNSTAATIAQQTANTVLAITERIAALEKSSYEGKGKQALSDPMMAELVAEMKSLRESRSVVTGKSQGIGASWVVLVAAVSLAGALLAIFQSRTAADKLPPAASQVVYVPAPQGTQLPVAPPQAPPR